MSIVPVGTEQAFQRGWLAAHAEISIAVQQLLSELPVPSNVPAILTPCCRCGEDLQPGEPADFVGRDAYMGGVYKHLGNCPRPIPMDDGPLYGTVRQQIERGDPG